ncbi:hypothetical protein AVEN_129447-1 [Araneus ventricosus]|uniref:Uncharacterized protein n=1 Tax=Araneus ventricosus TaxID=182803 RepID=A0A4Y2LV64_ARAVE|nr:hypothetical protein AVEN_129447-1 [Araneus ventricosus]
MGVGRHECLSDSSNAFVDGTNAKINLPSFSESIIRPQYNVAEFRISPDIFTDTLLHSFDFSGKSKDDCEVRGGRGGQVLISRLRDWKVPDSKYDPTKMYARYVDLVHVIFGVEGQMTNRPASTVQKLEELMLTWLSSSSSSRHD